MPSKHPKAVSEVDTPLVRDVEEKMHIVEATACPRMPRNAVLYLGPLSLALCSPLSECCEVS